MTPEEIKNQRRLNFRQTNAYAMQYGALMGGYAVAAEVCFVLGLKMAPLMNIQSLLTLAYPLVVLLVAFRFRKQVSEGLPLLFWSWILLYSVGCTLLRCMGSARCITLSAAF